MPPLKPAYGAPCNQCGECCRARLCVLGTAMFGPGGPCPGLVGNSCGLVGNPQAYAPVRVLIYGVDRMRQAALMLIGAGVGCDAKLESEPDNPFFDEFLQRERAQQDSAILAALMLWLEPLPPGYED